MLFMFAETGIQNIKRLVYWDILLTTSSFTDYCQNIKATSNI